MDRIEKLDSVLKLLAKANEDFSDDEIFLQMQTITNSISLEETRMILNKLVKSGYAETYEHETKYYSDTVLQDPTIIISTYFKITYDGYEQDLLGGYTNLIEKENQKSAQIQLFNELQIKQHRINESIKTANWIIAIGTILTIFYYAIDLYRK